MKKLLFILFSLITSICNSQNISFSTSWYCTTSLVQPYSEGYAKQGFIFVEKDTISITDFWVTTDKTYSTVKKYLIDVKTIEVYAPYIKLYFCEKGRYQVRIYPFNWAEIIDLENQYAFTMLYLNHKKINSD